MTSRRPMTRSYSGNGRTSSFEEEGSSSNREIRNPYLSNVRPENSYSRYSHYRPPRSTLCSVMAQLTEDIQPSFETTLKSKAVSEKCNVKFTCVVTGYPAPELTWYKDDMQMDRYCGLPKYEIHRNGKNHTLQIYNCTLDDAAIYQASASNSKGIVSCSGVLEVGTMSEFLIHQRFFAKLKQKADNKRKELEDSKKQGKENVPREQPEGSPQRPPRKRPGLPPLAKEEPRAVEQIGAATSEPNGAGVEIEETAPQTPTGVGMEKVEDSPSQENVAKKKIKITNGMDGVTGGSRGRAMANMRQNSYDGGISLAQFLAETVSSQTVEEKQAEKTSEMDTSVPGLSKDSEREREATCREVKDIKDFFFGKGKKDSHGHRDREEKGDYNPATHGQPSPPQTPPPSARREGYGAHTEDVPMALDESREPSQADKSPVDRLDVKALPTHAALSPASLRRFLSRAGPRSDSPTAVAVPAITVGDPQSDRTGGELSGGSTPTSSLSCESSPRLKRRDSLSLIRSATPEELASGARRKIFMPRAKGEDGGEGVGPGVQGVLDAAAKRETPYMSPSQARRAALLQAPAGQSTPPMERRSPLLNRRKATLEVPKAVEVKPAEEPDSNKSEDKPAESKIFMPRAKGEDGGEGVGLGVQLVPDTAAKRETPYMSPSQARRAALLQAPAGQSTPPMERRSPLLNRRKATLEVPKVVEVKPAEGPDSNKSEDKPAESKIFMPRAKGEDGGEGVGLGVQVVPDAAAKRETPYMSPSQARRAALLQPPAGQSTPPMERRSPLLNRRKATLEVPKVVEVKPAEGPDSNKSEDKPAEKEKLDPFKAPQVIRKIRGEPFPDASGHLKLWCQFFNILSDSTIKWYRDEEEILEVKRSGGDESQVALAIVQASSPDCGVYGCTIKNEYGTDTTDFLLSMDILADILLKEDLEVGEEIEMTPLRFTKGLADVGCWGEKFFGRIMTKESHMGEGCAHKACRAKVIYGLEPVFESGSTCIMKVQSPIPYGTKEDRNLAERNLEITKQECKIQNMIREYCKIFAAEARVIENFGFSLEVIPQYLMYRPANSVPYATVETDLPGVFLKYCMMDATGGLITRNTSEVEQKCCTFQHWIHQWTHGNLLVTHLQGVETKLTNIRVVTKSKGYQGLTEKGSPDVLEQFAAQHQCNYYCGLLDLRSLKIKGSRSPMLNRKMSIGSSPQLQRRGVNSPQTSRKSTSSPKVPRKTPGVEESSQTAKANNDGTSEMVLKR
ncbi:hypothetical protein NHX12_003197 [Muraenolepis orangiensis]|uniref:non-specific serine/threonine protein kinase n=1 Tax=Muraenolepis orangiensis TaxID=630683 RepID=A0A9Q0DY02_9TELE|nr:hypothetical protein NHX12_003197 [Muraenolepis orangiensis]